MNWFTSTPPPEPPPPAPSSSWLWSESPAAVPPPSESYALSYTQRLTMFIILFALAGLFFFLASLSIVFPVKFSKLFFLGSFFLISSLAFLVGPWALLSAAFSRERLLSTTSYIGSLMLTLACSVWLESTLLTMVALALQLFCSAWLALSFLPFSASFLGYASRSILPI